MVAPCIAKVTTVTRSPSSAVKVLESTKPGIDRARSVIAAAIGPYSPAAPSARRLRNTVTIRAITTV
jgi:hypothetical protein